MERKSDIKNKWLHLRLSDAEYQQLQRQFQKTTERKISTYARKILLGKPIIAAVRNQSLDEIITVLNRLQQDLNGVANNYNQMVHKLHTLDHIPEFRLWVKDYEKYRPFLMQHIEMMKGFIAKTAEKWLL